MTGDVQRELASALIEAKVYNAATVDHLTVALLPTVQTLIADAEKRAAARALREAAEDWGTPRRSHRPVHFWLLDRADALDPT